MWAGVAFSGALLLLLVVAAIGAGRIPSASGDSQLAISQRVLQWVFVYGTWVLLVLMTVWLLVGRRARRKVQPKRSSWLVSALVLTALFVVVLELGKHMPEIGHGVDQTVTSLPAPPDTSSVSVPSKTTLPAGSPGTLLIVVGGVVLVAVMLAVIGRERSGEPSETSDERPAFVSVLDDLIAELERSSDPRKIVIGAYARMEQALARDGLSRRGSEAPLEFLERALEHLEVSGHAVRRLTTLFAEARFSRHDIDETMSLSAIAALREVRRELGVHA